MSEKVVDSNTLDISKQTDNRMIAFAHSPSPTKSLPIKEGYKKKVFVYACCKNESHSIEKYMNWASEADGVFFLDSGSSDGTQELIKKLGGFVVEDKVSPWRFDEAKNKAMNLVPDDADICVCFNLDESMMPEKGWRKILEQVWQYDTTNAKYEYIFSHILDGSKQISFTFNAIHNRKDVFWKYATHEVMGSTGKPLKEINTNFECHHWRPDWKPKSNDLMLLEISCKEYPNDSRIWHYYGRELFYHGKWQQAIEVLKKHISMETWNLEKAASMNMIAKSFEKLKNYDVAECWYLKACSEAPSMREHWVYLGKFYMNIVKSYVGGYWCGKRALLIDKRDMSHYLCNEAEWKYGPIDLVSVCGWYAGLKHEAKENVDKMIKVFPNDKRIQYNYKFITDNMDK
jgi:tetratricopeptide (TPR) repeat protein